jgi:DNA-binding NtrC family response regulator
VSDEDATLPHEGPLSMAVPVSGAQAHPIRLDVLDAAGQVSATWSGTGRCTLGSHPSNDLVIADPTVSRLHAEVIASETGAVVRDLASTNGTSLDGLRIQGAWARDGSLIALGATRVPITIRTELAPVAISSRTRFGDLVGSSLASRHVFGLLERCASTPVTVLIEGETGTGKDLAAEALHREGPRPNAPFVVIDCGALPAPILESELFGHEQGAFTGATSRQIGAFEAASGGTVFLDEIGELPLELQPKLLRVLEERTIRRVGSTARIAIDVRIIAATNRSLALEVNGGRFRSDLFYRLAVARIELPPLRERIEDVPLLADALLERLGADEGARRRLLTPKALASLAARAWPGNVRELRNVLERMLLFGAPDGAAAAALPSGVVDVSVPWPEARRRALESFERSYVDALLAAHGGNVSRAAKAAGIDRVYLHRLMRRAR